HCIRMVTESRPQIARETVSGAAPMGQLMKDDGIVAFGCRTRISRNELIGMRYGDEVTDTVIVGHVAAMTNVGARACNERFHVLAYIHVRSLLRLGWRPTVHLLGIKCP